LGTDRGSGKATAQYSKKQEATEQATGQRFHYPILSNKHGSGSARKKL
jgi:hypothetical protein